MTEEHKSKIKDALAKSRAEKIALGIPLKEKKVKVPTKAGKPILYYTGQEETGFDFWTKIRNILRPLHQYDLCKKIERELVDNKMMWKNITYVLEILSKYFYLQLEGSTSSVKESKPKKAKRVLTEEHKKAMLNGKKKSLANSLDIFNL